ncbi:hypothetical protein EASAB2608_00150 [Streptomyces sp. EAS-AB2608]|uniref:Uncharacterized protein n=1 Tax=Streptomyces bangladeshensis TaxID=295352 RepID=A0ABN3BHS7_9ACTN|nr:hypothetical protein EASAB2608_00150 [Streptomyces sp. EAS-AB2608]
MVRAHDGPPAIPSFPTWLMGIVAEGSAHPKREFAWWTPLSRVLGSVVAGQVCQGFTQAPGASVNAETSEGS